MWRKRNPSALLAGMQSGVATVENNMELPQKLKMELPKKLKIHSGKTLRLLKHQFKRTYAPLCL